MILVKVSSKYRRGNPRDDLQWERLDLLFTMFGNALRNGLILNQDVRSMHRRSYLRGRGGGRPPWRDVKGPGGTEISKLGL